MARVLFIDHRITPSDGLLGHLREMGHYVTCALTLEEGFRQAREGKFDAVYLNPQMPDGDGMYLLPKILKAPSQPEVIILTDSSNPDEAESAIKNGAWDYVARSGEIQAMSFPLFRALQYRSKKGPNNFTGSLKKETFAEIIGNSHQMKRCMEMLAQAAQSDANVLILGETGTGKELFAWAIHNNSPRADKNFVIVDCASLPETLVESTLFGYEKGAYTGAEKSHIGLIKQADGGTLFLDEVSELPLAVQSSFLRVLQERRFRPVGGTQEISSEFRLIAATNQNIGDKIESKQFREDLLFRLQTLTLELPPLRKRPEDIKFLALYHTANLCDRYGMGLKEFSSEFLDVLHQYPWPGNVRELVNALERAVISARYEPVLFPQHLPTHIRIQVARTSFRREGQEKPPAAEEGSSPKTLPKLKDLRAEALSELERKYLQDLLSLTRGDIQEALRISGLSRSRLYGLLKKYQMSLS